jgi:hypothetical protein
LNGKPKTPVPQYRYSLAKVNGSKAAGVMEKLLREKLEGFGLSFFAICHPDGCCDVMGDSGITPLADAALCKARAVAAASQKA